MNLYLLYPWLLSYPLFFSCKTNLILEFKFLGVLQISLEVRLHTFSRATVNFLQSSSDSESGKIN